MGLMDKVKSLFTEEVEVEEELPKIPKRESKVEIETPKEKETKVEEKKQVVSDTPILTREERPKMPVYFDDTAFEDLKLSEVTHRAVKKNETKKFNTKPLGEAYKGNVKQEEAKVFKPSPIISPVYGILNENYHKEDIRANELEKPTVAVKKNKGLTVDDVRNQAYGTLEDDLENSFLASDNFDDEMEELNTRESRSTKVDLLREDFHAPKASDDISLEIEKQKQKINEINEYIKNTKSLKNSSNDDKKEEIEQTKEEPVVLKKVEENNDDNSGVESELFDLIDSMYEKRDEQ